MAQLIAGSTNDSLVPDAVYRLFQSVIKARTATWQAFQRSESNEPDPDIEKSNLTHRVFIDTLQHAFEVLRGNEWESSQDAQRLETGDDAENEIREALFSNKFSKLVVDGEQDDTEGEDPPPSEQPASTQQRRKTGKAKKWKGKKKAKKQQGTTPSGPDLESYRIIEDDSGTVTEYRMAVYALVQEWCELRAYLSGLWIDVAYAGLNSATAGVVSNMAIAMLERSESAVFPNFPDHDSYENVMSNVMRGDPERKDSIFCLSRWQLDSKGSPTEVVEIDVDMKELLLIHAYQDFMAFITDFQKNSNGKPSKALAKELGRWDPRLDLQKATKEERIKWRRSYTINWLYDLVNLSSSVVVQENTLQGQNWDLSKVDWSVTGPWNRHRRLFGLNEFAGFVCSMAWQKQGTNVSKRIMPHHILHLQVIIDSLTVSRGWSVSVVHGHVVREPALQFRPLRDVDRFLDRENNRFGSGYLQAADKLKQLLKEKTERNAWFEHRAHVELLEKQSEDFRDWLGESKYRSGPNTTPPSRFSHTDSNGLWEYSPFLCGVSLMEGLELAYCFGMSLWDDMPEPVLAVHLHNMLVQKGYITEPVSLYKHLQHIFQQTLFSQGAVPTSNFAATLKAQIQRRSNTFAVRRKLAQRREISRSQSADNHTILDVRHNMFFTFKPNLILCREADWNPELVPERDITVGSKLGIMRLSQVKQLVDPKTGKRRFEHTELVRRHLAAKVDGKPVYDEETLLDVVDGWKIKSRGFTELDEPPKGMGGEFYELFSSSYSNANELRSRNQVTGGGTPLEVRGSDLLDMMKVDTHADIAGNNPVVSLNYAWVTVRIMLLFHFIEEKLRERKNPVYLKAFKTWRSQPRFGLVYMAMLKEDEECLRVMAEEFQSPIRNYVYWDVMTDLPRFKAKPESACTVM